VDAGSIPAASTISSDQPRLRLIAAAGGTANPAALTLRLPPIPWHAYASEPRCLHAACASQIGQSDAADRIPRPQPTP